MYEHIVKSYDDDLNSLRSLLSKMFKEAEQQLEEILVALKEHNKEHITTIISNDEKINILDKEIIDLSINIFTLRNPLAYDLRLVFTSSHVSRNLERIGDNIVSAAEHALQLTAFDEELEDLLIKMAKNLKQMVYNMSVALENGNVEFALNVALSDTEIDLMYEEITLLALDKMIESKDKIVLMYNYLLISKFLERIGEHVVNISKYISYIENADMSY